MYTTSKQLKWITGDYLEDSTLNIFKWSAQTQIKNQPFQEDYISLPFSSLSLP